MAMITYIREDADKKLSELKSKNIPVYSVSKKHIQKKKKNKLKIFIQFLVAKFIL